MTLGEFRKLTKNAADTLPLLVPISDHGYREATAEVGLAIYEGRGRFGEYDGPDQGIRQGHAIVAAVIVT